ncbi:LolA family protein [Candidatus Avelusimicrobium sp.]|uniref:LolA family protein n=1 Tax=Candidatus Avelusimicrobium sp. TaxID=3048833 RepID=UPI003D7D6701
MKILLLVLAMFLTPLAWAEPAQKAECAGEVPPVQNVAQKADDLAQIAARFSAVQTIHSRFTQEKHMALLTEPVVSEGVFSFEKSPARIRWEYQKPFKNGFILDGSSAYRLEEGKKTPVKGVMARNIAAQMLVWLSFDLQTLSKTYAITVFEGGVRLKPLSGKNKMLEEISVWFAADNPQALSKIQMTEPGGDYTVLSFTETQINKPLAEGTFK